MKLYERRANMSAVVAEDVNLGGKWVCNGGREAGGESMVLVQRDMYPCDGIALSRAASSVFGWA